MPDVTAGDALAAADGGVAGELVDTVLAASRALAAELGVNPSTVTRMCDRLVRKGLVRRHRSAGDRRGGRGASAARRRARLGGPVISCITEPCERHFSRTARGSSLMDGWFLTGRSVPFITLIS